MKFTCLVVAIAWMAPSSRAFVVPSSSRAQQQQQQRVPQSLLLQSESSRAEDTENDSPTQQQKMELERQRQDTKEMLDSISALKNVILTEGTVSSSAKDDATSTSLEDYQEQVDQLEANVHKLELEFVPPPGLTLAEYKAAMVFFLSLPYSARCAFCEALELEEPAKAATDLQRMPDIVAQLYQQRMQLTPQRLQDALKTVQTGMKAAGALTASSNSHQGNVFSNNNNQPSTDNKNNNASWQGLSELFGGDEGKTEEELGIENTVKNFLGRVTRKDDVVATKQDLDRIVKACDKETFVVASTTKIPGGYVIRGRNVKKTGAELIQAVDAKLPDDFPSQVFLMDDISTTEAIMDDSEPVLVLLNKDFSPRVSGILTTLCSTAALISAFVFCVSTYGSNEVVANQLSEATAINDSAGVSLFTDRVYDVLLPLLCIQVWHDLAHLTAAKLNKMDMGFPTLLPFWSLPIMGTKTDLTSSPANRSALLDFALAGPFVGIMGSLACLAFGLQLTGTADAETLRYFPSLPVGVLSSSTLGGSMVDFFLGGGLAGTENRFITMQDAATPVFMHPLAIAGFCGLVINAISMLPLGSSDGGRASLAVFGRYGHALVGGATWLAILVASFSLERADILIGAWLVSNVVQNDMEIPCRDETEDVSIPRFMAALSLWFVTLLAIVPLS